MEFLIFLQLYSISVPTYGYPIQSHSLTQSVTEFTGVLQGVHRLPNNLKIS